MEDKEINMNFSEETSKDQTTNENLLTWISKIKREVDP